MTHVQLEKDDLSFALFFSLWATVQKWDVPALHWEVIQFLDHSDDWELNTAVLQIFRGAGKSTIIALWIVYMLVKDPTLRFLVLSADHLTAKRITADCQNIIKRHPLAMGLKGKERTWQKDRFFVRGSTDARNPSVAAHGIMSNITSARADFVVFDDVEVPKNCNSSEMREQLRARISETTHILIPQTGKTLFVGTPHTFESIYPENIKAGATSLTLPMIVKPEGEFPYLTGESRWPERFNPDTIKQRQLRSKSKAEFLSQYQLMPMNIEDSILDPTLLQVYDDEVEFRVGNGQWSAIIGEKLMMSVSSFWDVSLSKARGDDSVLAIVFTDGEGHIYIHRTLSIEGDVHQQCQQVADYAKDFNVPIVIVETNGVGAFVPQILLEKTRGKGIGVDGRATSKNKAIKIIEAFETPLSGGFLHVHKSVYDSKFTTQLREFSPRLMKEHDDFIDAPASAIDNEPIRIGRISCPLTQDSIVPWRNGSGSVEAEMDYASI